MGAFSCSCFFAKFEASLPETVELLWDKTFQSYNMWDCGTHSVGHKMMFGQNKKHLRLVLFYSVQSLLAPTGALCNVLVYIDQAMQGFLRFSLGPAPVSSQSLKITSIVIHATQVQAIPCNFLKISLCGTKHSKSIESILFFGQCHLRAKLKLLKLSA